jgi:4-amino-4-deoxychorismate lyase
MSAVVLRGGERQAGIDPADRGLAYGDGVFETLLVHAGAPVWWDAHWARLRLGVATLGFEPPAEDVVRGHVVALLADAPPRAVLKIIVSRGAGGRGYAPTPGAEPTVVLSAHDAPTSPPSVTLRWCQTRWSSQPRLAGIKHLNRLEQVLARAEWSDPEIFEGVVLDGLGQVASATAANVFVRLQGEWRTPPVEACGIAGLLRAWVLAHATGARVAAVTPAELLAADEVFLCNAVRGILPVRRLEGREWTAWAATTDLRRRLAGAEPAFECGES